MAQVDQAALWEHLSAHLARQPWTLHAGAPGGVGLSPEELCSSLRDHFYGWGLLFLPYTQASLTFTCKESTGKRTGWVGKVR